MATRSTRKPVVDGLEPRILLTVDVPEFSSFPEADHVAYLDFDGQNVTGSSWNSRLSTIHAPAFDIDGDPNSFNEEELNRIERIWGQMTEDFRPFNINVTTVDPSIDDPDIFSRPGVAQRIIFSSKFDSGPGGTGEQWVTTNQLAGVAALDSWFRDNDNPIWVFATHGYSGNIGSHELGHAFGLEHDGEDDGERHIEYRSGHGFGETRWSPLMGLPGVFSQWSDGSYENATNDEKDVGILAQALGFRADDFPGITPLDQLEDGSFFQEGMIHEQADADRFTFEVTEPDSVVRIDATPWHESPNLDIGLALWGPASSQFGASDPEVNPRLKLSSSFERELPQGTYYLTIDGVGKSATDNDEGYPDYGSLGYYKITGSIRSLADGIRGDINADNQLDAQDIDALYALIGTAAAVGESDVDSVADLNEDGAVDQNDVDILVRDILGTDYGDFDLNRRVDFSDFLHLAANFGRADVGWQSGDVDGDREVAFNDFLMLAAAFGFDADRD